jgi:adenylylsulfate kinase-like enzyme
MSENTILEKVNGLWFYGLAGSGKTYASKFVSQRIMRPFIVDGDAVRKHVSIDLGYSQAERNIQTLRIFGIGYIALENGMFPIMSSVTMTNDLLKSCQNLSISVVRIDRPFEHVKAVRDLYDGQKNVVGVDQSLQKLNTLALVNDGTENFDRELVGYATGITA